MILIIDFIVYFFLIPVIYLMIALFNFNLIHNARSETERLLVIFGIFGAILISTVIIMWNTTTVNLIVLPDTKNSKEILPYIVFAFFFGLLLMAIINFLLRAQQEGLFLVSLITVFLVIMSTYFLIVLPVIRDVISLSFMGFFLGVIVYILFAPNVLRLMFANVHLTKSTVYKENLESSGSSQIHISGNVSGSTIIIGNDNETENSQQKSDA